MVSSIANVVSVLLISLCSSLSISEVQGDSHGGEHEVEPLENHELVTRSPDLVHTIDTREFSLFGRVGFQVRENGFSIRAGHPKLGHRRTRRMTGPRDAGRHQRDELLVGSRRQPGNAWHD